MTASTRFERVRRPEFHRLLIPAAVGLAIMAGSARADHPAAGFGAGVAGPVTTIGADVLLRGHWAAALRMETALFDAFSDAELLGFDAAGEDVHSVDRLYSPSLGLAYGISSQVTVTARLPYVARVAIRAVEDEGSGPEVHDHGDAKGLGDLTVLGIGAVRHSRPGRLGIAFWEASGFRWGRMISRPAANSSKPNISPVRELMACSRDLPVLIRMLPFLWVLTCFAHSIPRVHSTRIRATCSATIWQAVFAWSGARRGPYSP